MDARHHIRARRIALTAVLALGALGLNLALAVVHQHAHFPPPRPAGGEAASHCDPVTHRHALESQTSRHLHDPLRALPENCLLCQGTVLQAPAGVVVTGGPATVSTAARPPVREARPGPAAALPPVGLRAPPLPA